VNRAIGPTRSTSADISLSLAVVTLAYSRSRQI